MPSASNYLLPVTKSLLGIEEKELVKLSSDVRCKRFVHKGSYFKNEKLGNCISFGTFETPTVAVLQEKVSRILDSNKIGDKRDRKDVPSLMTRPYVDIAELQGNLTTEDRAMVQVASNFNCLENPSRKTNIGAGWLVDNACRARTQGPAAVFGTTSAYLYRCHFYEGGQSSNEGGNEVNLLRHVSQYFGTPQVGKLTLTGNETLLRNEEDINKAVAKTCIGFHQDCPIMFGRTCKSLTYNKPNKKDIGSTKILEYPLVDQVLSASINLWDYGTNHNKTEATMINLTRTLLRAAYEGIYLAAILRQRRALYLTLVGGGNFGVPIPLIVEEIERAHLKFASHSASKLESVTICLYSKKDEMMVKAAIKKNRIARFGERASPPGTESNTIRKEQQKRNKARKDEEVQTASIAATNNPDVP